MNSKSGSKVSDGINSYFGKISAQRTSGLNPNADYFVPERVDKSNVKSQSHPGTQAVTVRPKQAAVTQTDIRPVTRNTQAQMTQVVYDAQHTEHGPGACFTKAEYINPG